MTGAVTQRSSTKAFIVCVGVCGGYLGHDVIHPLVQLCTNPTEQVSTCLFILHELRGSFSCLHVSLHLETMKGS